MTALRIKEKVIVAGSQGWVEVEALIDTGAMVSHIPVSIAQQIGVEWTGEITLINGVGGQENASVAFGYLSFPNMAREFKRVKFRVLADFPEMLIGMDVLSPLGVTIDTAKPQLSIDSGLWKFAAGIGLLGIGGGVGYLIGKASDTVDTDDRSRSKTSTKATTRKATAKKGSAKKGSAKKGSAKKPTR